MNTPHIPSPRPSDPAMYGGDLGREQVYRLGRLCAAVVTAGVLLVGTSATADAASAHAKHTGHAKHAHKASKKRAKAAKRRAAAWFATGPQASVTGQGSATTSTVSDASGDVSSSGSMLNSLSSAERQRVSTNSQMSSDADLSGVTITRDGNNLEVTVDTSGDFSGQQGLSIPGVVDLGATETYHFVFHGAGGATVYSASGSVDGSGQASSGDDMTANGDGSVTFTIPVGALPRHAELHAEATTDVALTGSAAGGMFSATLSGHLDDALDFGFHTGS